MSTTDNQIDGQRPEVFNEEHIKALKLSEKRAFYRSFATVSVEERSEYKVICPHCRRESDWGDEVDDCLLDQIATEEEAEPNEYGLGWVWRCDKCKGIFIND